MAICTLYNQTKFDYAKILYDFLLFRIYFLLELAHKIQYIKPINIYLFQNILVNHSLHLSWLTRYFINYEFFDRMFQESSH